MNNLCISQVMTRGLVTVAPDESLNNATALMERNNVHHLLVVEHDRMVGILSSADLLKLALLVRPDTHQSPAESATSIGLKVRDVMQTRVAVVRTNTSLKEAARALSLGGFHALPVLAIDGTPVGIVTSSDLVCLLIDRIDSDPASEAKAAVSQPGAPDAAMRHLLDVLRAAEIYLNSGQSDQQHARLTRAVTRARERIG